MLSTLSILLLLLSEADVQLSLFKAGAVWLLMLRVPGCSFALLLCLTYSVLNSEFKFCVCFHANWYCRSAGTSAGNYLKAHYCREPYNPNFWDFSKRFNFRWWISSSSSGCTHPVTAWKAKTLHDQTKKKKKRQSFVLRSEVIFLANSKVKLQQCPVCYLLVHEQWLIS